MLKKKSIRLLVFTCLMAALFIMNGLGTGRQIKADDTVTVTITMDANGGTFTKLDNETGEYLPTKVTSYKLLVSKTDNVYNFFTNGYGEPKLEGKGFMGWCSTKDGSGHFYWDYSGTFTSDDLDFPMDGSVKTLYAVWGDIRTFTLDGNGGYFSDDPDKTTSTAKITYWQQPTAAQAPLGGGFQDGFLYFIDGVFLAKRDGYRLTGWSVKKTAAKPDTDRYLNISKLDDSVTTLYAYWSPVYMITLHGNGGGAFGYETIGGETHYLQQRNVEFYYDPWTGGAATDEQMSPWPWAIDDNDALVGWTTSSGKTYKAHLEDLDLSVTVPDDLYACWIKRDITQSVNVDGVSDQVYNGENITLKLNVYSKNFRIPLTEDQDYTVSYENNLNVGTATVTIRGKGDFTGTIRKTFRIAAREITPTVILSGTSFTYDSKSHKPTVTVKDCEMVLDKSTYDVTYPAGCKDAGEYKVTVDMKGNYYGTATASFTIKQAKQPMTVKAKTVTLKASKLKKKAQTVKISKALTIKKAKGTKTFKITSKGKLKKIKINKKTGKITVPKGTKKGTYTIKIKVTAAGNNNYKKGTKTVKVKIKIK